MSAATKPPTILVVEDDATTRELVATALRKDGYEVVTASRGENAPALAREHKCAAIVLDLGLPDGDGIEWCREWRRRGVNTPILMATARAEVGSRVAGLDAGADDYLSKPFAMSELKARLRALLRRAGSARERRVFAREGLRIDFAKRRATLDGTEIPVTRREFEVFERLVEAKGRVIEKDDLLEELWGESTPQNAASLEVIVARLRRKLGEGLSAPLIRTVRGAGYAMEEAHSK